MALVAILVNGTRPQAARLATETSAWLASRGHRCRLLELPDADRAAGLVPAGALSGADLSGADLAVSIGGDGTFLRLVPLAYTAGVPVLGVNFGRLGYLLEVHPDRFLAVLERTLDGDAAYEERVVLAVTVQGSVLPAAGDDRSLPGGGPGGGDGDRWWVALNEAVTEKTVPGHMVHLATTIDGEPALTYKADGALVATPTGSTAYSLSAGGPVVSPLMRAMIVTPVAAHLTMDRSLVLAPEQVATVEVLPPRPAVLVVDGREVGRLSPGAVVECRLAPGALRMVTLGTRRLGTMLRTTLSPEREA